MKNPCSVFIIALFCLLLNHQELIAQHDNTASDLSRFVDWTVKDPVYVAKGMKPQDLGILIAAGISIAGVSALDRRSSTYFQSRLGDSSFFERRKRTGEL